MTVRYGFDGWDDRLHPVRPDHSHRRPRSLVGPIGVHALPSECEHPVTARVWPDVRPYVARCSDCGLHITRAGVWMYA